MPAGTRPSADRRRRLAAGALALVLAAAPGPGRGAERQDPYAVEAAMLVNVVKFVTWPGGARQGGALRVCVIATSRFAAALAELGRRGAPIEVVEVRTPARVGGCQVAVLGAPVDDDLEEAAEQLGAAGILTVSEHPGAARRGVHVNYVIEGDRVRLEVNLAAARRAGFDVSSKLLRLARVVEGGAS